MSKTIDIDIHSIRQTPVVSIDDKGNILMKMITEQLKKKEKEKSDASNDS